MFRIDDPTAAAALPTPEAAGTEGYFTEGNPATSTAATNVRASFLNMVQEELRNVVSASGQTPSKTNYYQLLQALRVLASAPVGQARNVAMAVSAASASGTLTADEIIVGTALGGQTYKLASFSKSVNLATTGAGGMDTGSAPVSGYVALYAIYNPTSGVSALLAVNATSAAAPTVYGGANMPSGYTASALVSVWPTNASSQFKVGAQVDRQVSVVSTSVLSTSSIVSAASLSIASVVPKNARMCGGYMRPSNSSGASQDTGITIFSDASGTGGILADYALTSASGGGLSTPFCGLLLPTAQTLWYTTQASAGTPTFSVFLSSYTI